MDSSRRKYHETLKCNSIIYVQGNILHTLYELSFFNIVVFYILRYRLGFEKKEIFHYHSKLFQI